MDGWMDFMVVMILAYVGFGPDVYMEGLVLQLLVLVFCPTMQESFVTLLSLSSLLLIC